MSFGNNKLLWIVVIIAVIIIIVVSVVIYKSRHKEFFMLSNKRYFGKLEQIPDSESNKSLTGVVGVFYRKKTTFPAKPKGRAAPLPLCGTAVSGGGSRAMACAWGFYSALSKNNVLNIDKIAYCACNSGGSWATIALFYYAFGGAGPVAIGDTLMTIPPYNDYNPANLTVAKIQAPLREKDLCKGLEKLGLINFFLDFIMPGKNLTDTWFDQLTIHLFTKMGLDSSYKNSSIPCYDINELSPGLRQHLGEKGIGITPVRPGFPIPIAAIEFYTNEANLSYQKRSLYMDADPFSTGFLVDNTAESNNTRYGGRTSSYAFNPTILDNVDLIDYNDPDTTPYYIDSYINVNNWWSVIKHTGYSSLAPGTGIIRTFSFADLRGLLTPINVPVINQEVEKAEDYIVADGGDYDNLGLISLLARGMRRIVLLNATSSRADDPDDNLGRYFGEPCSTLPNTDAIQVFPNTDWGGIVAELLKTGVVVYRTKTRANEVLNIPGGIDVDLLIIQNMKCETSAELNCNVWWRNLRAETKTYIKDYLWSSVAGSFPLYSTFAPGYTFFQFVGMQEIQIRALAYMHAYIAEVCAVPFINGIYPKPANNYARIISHSSRNDPVP